jgi:putative membrane protein
MVAFWTAFLALAVWAVTQIFPTRPSAGSGPDSRAPGERLDERLATGEIDVETYRRLRHELSGSTSDR